MAVSGVEFHNRKDRQGAGVSLTSGHGAGGDGVSAAMAHSTGLLTAIHQNIRLFTGIGSSIQMTATGQAQKVGWKTKSNTTEQACGK